MSSVKNRDQFFGVFKANRLPQVIDYFAHVQNQHQAPAQIVLAKKSRVNENPSRVDKLLG